MSATSPGGPFRQQLLGTVSVLTGVVTGVATGTSPAHHCGGYTNLTVYLTASAALSAGTLIVEEADYNQQGGPAYGGAWSQITSVTLSSPFASAGGQVAVHLGGPGGAYAYSFVRVRIGTDVVGGTLAATLVGC